MINPLLEISGLPNQAPAFDHIKTEHYLPAVKEAIKTARANIDDIKNNPESPNFQNTIVALEICSQDLDSVCSIFYNQLLVENDDKLQALAEEIGPLNAAFSNDILLDGVLFQKIEAIYSQKEELDLNTEERTLLEDTYKSFTRNGALLDDAKKEQLREIDNKLSTLGPDFSNKVTKSSEDFEMFISDQDSLSGLPENSLDQAKSAATEYGASGKWLFTLNYSSYIPFMKYADNRALREQMWRAFTSRSYKDKYDNCDNIFQIVKLRHERARLLGYETHAHYVLEKRMTETPENVSSFLERLKSAYLEAAKKDLKMLQDFAKENNGPEDLKPWDISYYGEKMKQDLFDYTSEDLRPYFPLETVLQGVFAHFSKLFNLRFEENHDYQIWHESVVSYDIYDQEKGAFLGTLFSDFYPRKGKREGAWQSAYRTQGFYKGKIERPVTVVCCNFTKPTETKPSLLTFGEVTTFLHEMGHALHALLSDVTYQSNQGTSVMRDFVELPSQLQENWAYERETLDMLSGHYESGEKIPDTLLEKLIRAKNFMAGWVGVQQLRYATLDMAWHTADPEDIEDVCEFEDRVLEEISLFPRLSGPTSTAFGHIFAGGYSAGYYGYKWAEVLDADAFELFKEKGLYDSETANRYRFEILAKGGSDHPSTLYRNFRGRDADPDALLRREGLLGENSSKAA